MLIVGNSRIITFAKHNWLLIERIFPIPILVYCRRVYGQNARIVFFQPRRRRQRAQCLFAYVLRHLRSHANVVRQSKLFFQSGGAFLARQLRLTALAEQQLRRRRAKFQPHCLIVHLRQALNAHVRQLTAIRGARVRRQKRIGALHIKHFSIISSIIVTKLVYCSCARAEHIFRVLTLCVVVVVCQSATLLFIIFFITIYAQIIENQISQRFVALVQIVFKKLAI